MKTVSKDKIHISGSEAIAQRAMTNYRSLYSTHAVDGRNFLGIRRASGCKVAVSHVTASLFLFLSYVLPLLNL